MNRAKNSALVLALVLGLAGCESFQLMAPGDRQSSDVLVSGQVRVMLKLDRTELTPPGVILAMLRYENLGASSVEITSGYGCLSFAGVYRGEERIPFPSTDYYCTTAVTKRELAPGQQIGMDWPLHIGEHGVDLGPGQYRFVAQLNTHAEDLDVKFVVR